MHLPRDERQRVKYLKYLIEISINFTIKWLVLRKENRMNINLMYIFVFPDYQTFKWENLKIVSITFFFYKSFFLKVVICCFWSSSTIWSHDLHMKIILQSIYESLESGVATKFCNNLNVQQIKHFHAFYTKNAHIFQFLAQICQFQGHIIHTYIGKHFSSQHLRTIPTFIY